MKMLATVVGIIFVLVGVLGFVPGVTENGHLLGVFHVNGAHNIVHILTGIAALIAGSMSLRASQNFFRIFGIVYGLVAVLGFITGGDEALLGLIANNHADNWLHAAIAAGSLLVGFAPHLLEHRRTAAAGTQV
jgi:hypothetical protein